jgi:hypothetical protein
MLFEVLQLAFLSCMASSGPGIAEIVDQDIAPKPRWWRAAARSPA